MILDSFVFITMKIQVMVSWVVIFSHYGRQHIPPKHWFLTTPIHGITTQKTTTWTQQFYLYMEITWRE